MCLSNFDYMLHWNVIRDTQSWSGATVKTLAHLDDRRIHAQLTLDSFPVFLLHQELGEQDPAWKGNKSPWAARRKSSGVKYQVWLLLWVEAIDGRILDWRRLAWHAVHVRDLRVWLAVSLLSLEKLAWDLECTGIALNGLQVFIIFVLVGMFREVQSLHPIIRREIEA